MLLMWVRLTPGSMLDYAPHLHPLGKTIVTVICDGGDRYRSKLFTESWLKVHDPNPDPKPPDPNPKVTFALTLSL